MQIGNSSLRPFPDIPAMRPQCTARPFGFHPDAIRMPCAPLASPIQGWHKNPNLAPSSPCFLRIQMTPKSIGRRHLHHQWEILRRHKKLLRGRVKPHFQFRLTLQQVRRVASCIQSGQRQSMRHRCPMPLQRPLAPTSADSVAPWQNAWQLGERRHFW